MADDQLASAISNMGGFGLADAMVKQMMGQIEAARGGALKSQPNLAVKTLNN
jgi:Rod binding domain-containing protein